MFNLLDETRISMTDLAREEELNVGTIWRWANRGVRGVRLETFARGGRRFTTREAYRRFVESTTDKIVGTPQGNTPRRLENAVRRAESVLEAHGI